MLTYARGGGIMQIIGVGHFTSPFLAGRQVQEA